MMAVNSGILLGDGSSNSVEQRYTQVITANSGILPVPPEASCASPVEPGNTRLISLNSDSRIILENVNLFAAPGTSNFDECETVGRCSHM